MKTIDRARDFLRNVFPDHWTTETSNMITKLLDEAVTDEVERCALLVTMRADISRESAKKLRERGTYTTRAIWPPFKLVTFVAPKWEQRALELEAFAHALDVVTDCIRKGYDPRDLPNTDKPADCIYPKCIVHGLERDFRGSQCVCDQHKHGGDKYRPGDEVGGYGAKARM